MGKCRDMTSYFRILKKQLVCPSSRRAHFIAETERMVADFQQGNPDATEEDIMEFLGNPRELAQTYLETLDYEELKRFRAQKTWFRRGFAFSVALTICLLSAWCIYLRTRPLTVEVTETITITVHDEVAS